MSFYSYKIIYCHDFFTYRITIASYLIQFDYNSRRRYSTAASKIVVHCMPISIYNSELTLKYLCSSFNGEVDGTIMTSDRHHFLHLYFLPCPCLYLYHYLILTSTSTLPPPHFTFASTFSCILINFRHLFYHVTTHSPSSHYSVTIQSLSHRRGVEKVVWVPAEEYKEPVDEKRKRKKKESL